MPKRLKIAGGRVYDPLHEGWGEVRDLYLAGDRLVAYLPEVDEVLDARQQAVLPGGVDLRGQVAGYGLNFLRLWGKLPSPSRLAEAYVTLGYTHVHEPFMTLATARYVHRQLEKLPLVDTSASLVVNLQDLDLWLKDRRRWEEVAETLRFYLEWTRALNLRVMEPWVRHRQEVYAHRNISLEETLELLTWLAGYLQHSIVLEASPEILRASLPKPQAFHLAALGAALTEDGLLDTALAQLEGGTTGDLGLVWPQEAPAGDGIPRQVDLGLSAPLKLWGEPSRDRASRALRLALAYKGQAAAFSGAGAFLAPVQRYAEMWGFLGNRKVRGEFWGENSGLREWTFREWVWATRTLPARLLGLTDRGHLGPGALADVALFDLPPGDPETRWPDFVGKCRTLLKGGVVVVDNFQVVREEVPKATWYRATGVEATPLAAELCQFLSLRPENFWLSGELEGIIWRRVQDR